MLLVAGAAGANASAPAAPAVSGTVRFSGDSRVIVEFDDDTLSVFYLLDVLNTQSSPVNPKTPVVFDLPAGATGAALLDGSSRQAQVSGRRVSVAGPFAPGRTSVQLAYQLPPAGDARTIQQPFPLAIDGLSVVVQKPGDVRLSSPQITTQRTVPMDGKMYIEAAAPAVPAGQVVTLDLSGLPHRATWPHQLALTIALIVLAAGAWSAMGGSHETAARTRRAELESRRERLFAELAGLEEAKRTGKVDEAAHDQRRAALMEALERIYGELDTASTGGPQPPEGSGRGMAA